MSFLCIDYPLFILMVCSLVVAVGISPVLRVPVDSSSRVMIPVIVVATNDTHVWVRGQS